MTKTQIVNIGAQTSKLSKFLLKSSFSFQENDMKQESGSLKQNKVKRQKATSQKKLKSTKLKAAKEEKIYKFQILRYMKQTLNLNSREFIQNRLLNQSKFPCPNRLPLRES